MIIIIIIIIMPYKDKLRLLSDSDRFSIFATGGGGFFLIPFKDMLMLFSDSAYLSKGMVGLLIPYEDKLMLVFIQHICQRG